MNKPQDLKFLLILSFFFSFISLQAQEPYWQQQVDFKIQVSLNPADNGLDAFETIQYTNNSPDTLRFIWFHVWPNAYKNDKTAFSDQLLKIGRTDFYFSDKNKKGFINRLDFRINDKVVKTEDHPEHIDIIKLVLPQPLLPAQSITITTPFHVQLPFNFSRGGYYNHTYQVTQWYPKPAVYDKNGWHPIPYLDQGEFYSEFGNYEVSIDVPERYVVAATGEPQFEVKNSYRIPVKPKKKKPGSTTKKIKPAAIDWASMPRKSYLYKQERVHDFAWFADTSFTVIKDTLRLASGKLVTVQSYYNLQHHAVWGSSLYYLKSAIRYYSQWLGDYPYNTVTAVDGYQGFTGGMEYPTITIITGANSSKSLDLTIFHEVGHNWLQGVLATNERSFPWMDEGINTYYENRYQALKYPYFRKQNGIGAFLADPRLPVVLYKNQAKIKMDQPINTPADSMSAANYNMITYTKTAEWIKRLDHELGHNSFDKAMKDYFANWAFKHPYPEDFKKAISISSGANTDSSFALLEEKGILPPRRKKPLQIVPLYNFRKTYDYQPLFITPVLAYNTFNGLMPGIAFHNYSLPLPKLNFAVAPFYGIKSKALNGWGRVAYQWYPNKTFQNIELSLIASKFNQNSFTDSLGDQFTLAFYKVVPALRLLLKEPDPTSTTSRFLTFKYFNIGEDQLRFNRDTVANTETYYKVRSRYDITQARFVIDNARVLYPYRGEMLAEISKEFVRLAFTGNYFFNFTGKGGVKARFFLGKFIYTSSKTSLKQFETERFQLNMSGPNGTEDYTYSNFFIGRTEFEGFPSQQMMIRDGAFKVRTDLLSSKIGKSDNWLSAVNLTMDIPDRLNPLSVLPIKIPLKIFADVGTNSEFWDKEYEGDRFLYDAGLQVSMLKDIINIYVPLLYSKVYKDYFKSTPNNSFVQRISFSINIQDISVRNLTKSFSQ
jgi:hypothetical protein